MQNDKKLLWEEQNERKMNAKMEKKYDQSITIKKEAKFKLMKKNTETLIKQSYLQD